MKTAVVSPELQKYVDESSYADLHPAVMKAVASGDFTILDLFDNLPWFKGAADWTAWRSFLCALYALPMTNQELAIYRECTGRKMPPSRPAREVWCPTGRRARKSVIAALIGVFEGGFRDYSPYLAPGERAVIPILGKSMEEAQQIYTFTKGILSDDSLRHLLESEPGAGTIRLITRVDLRIRAVSLTAGRSKAIPLGLLDEVAFFATEGAIPDVEVVRGIKPGMATIPDSKLFALSSPWGKRGLLYENFKLYHGAENEVAANKMRVLVWKAPTLRMHRTTQLEGEIKDAFAKDPVGAAAEYGADFREDTDAFVLERVLDAAIVRGRHELAPGWENYFAFVDPSGGSSDSLALAIGHFKPDVLLGPNEPEPIEVDFDPHPKEGVPPPPGCVVLDLVREWRAPFEPEEVSEQCALEIKRYGLRKVTGDKYGGKWPSAAFKKHDVIFYWSRKSKSELYREFLPTLNSGQVELLDIPPGQPGHFKQQFLDLDRRVARGGNESIDHVPGVHDDVANAVAGVLVEAKVTGSRMRAPARAVAPPTSTQEIHKRRIAEAIARSVPKTHTPGTAAGGNAYRRRGR